MQSMSSTSTTSQQQQQQPHLGIFYSVFDNVLGPQIHSQVPGNCIPEKTFEQISNYVFPQRDLLGSIVSVTAQNVQVISCSYSLESSKYVRHRFSFAVSMVFAPDEDSGPFQPVLHKMTKSLCNLELESSFLSNNKGKIGSILKRILDDLVLRGECQVNLGSTTLALKLFPKLLEHPPISDFKVPVLIRDLRALMTRDWDLTMQQIEPFIDGRNFIKRISHLSGVDLGMVRQCISQLLYYRVVAIVDVFQYGNFYALVCFFWFCSCGARMRFKSKTDSTFSHQVHKSRRVIVKGSRDGEGMFACRNKSRDQGHSVDQQSGAFVCVVASFCGIWR